MPSTISYQAPPPTAASFSIAPPRNPPKPVSPPLNSVSRHLSVPTIQTPHRRGHSPHSKTRGSSPSPRNGSPVNGPRGHASGHSYHSKRKPLTVTGKESKKRSPMVIDRKQVVYGSPHGKTSSSQHRQKSGTDHSVKSNTAEKRNLSMVKGDSLTPHYHNSKNLRASSPQPSGDINEVGIFEPVIVRGEIKGQGEPMRLERDPDGRLYEVVQTRLVEGGTTEDFNKRLSLPVVKSSTESNIPRHKDTGNYLLNLFSTSPRSSKMELSGSGNESSGSSRDLSNKENIAKNSNAPSPNPSDRPSQEALERLKKNMERKEAFLKRPNEPILKSTSSENIGGQQKKSQTQQVPQSESALSKAIAYLMGHRGDSQISRRVKHDAEEPSTVLLPSNGAQSLNNTSPLNEEVSNSFSSSPTDPPTSSAFQPLTPDTPIYSSLLVPLSPLTGNIVAKPYTAHLSEDGSSALKLGRPFIATLSRIQENIPSADKDSADQQIGVVVVSTTSMTAPTSSTSAKSNRDSAVLFPASSGSSNIVRTVPVLWVGDNERIRQLQIVSTRAKKFESLDAERDAAKKSALHRFELSRLSQRANDAINVANRRKEFEKRSGDKNSTQARSFELGTTFDCSSRLKNMEDAYWRNSKGVMKSLSDGGEFFSATRDYCSLPEDSVESPSGMGFDIPVSLGSGNRMIPIGGTKIHCEPPNSRRLDGKRPENDSELLARTRAHSTCSHEIFWPSAGGDVPRRKRGAPLVRQHSFHSTLQSHLARAVSSIQQRITAVSDGTSGSPAVPSSGTHQPTHTAAGFSKRNKHLYGEDHDRLVRRVSYLKATSGDRVCSESESEDEKPPSKTSPPASLARRAIGGPSPTEELPSPASFLSSVTSSGLLHVKLAKLHGKRAGDRSWKTVWAVIRGRALLLYKDKHHAVHTPLSPEDQVSLRGADGVVASDYTKRRHVVRLSTPAGSQFLLQAESEPAMTAWLNSITAAASTDVVEPRLKAMTPTPDNDSLAPHVDATAHLPTAITPTSSATGSLCVPELPAGTEGNVSPQLLPKHKKITSPLKTKSPSALATHSKNRKSGEMGSSPKSKTWKGRLGRHLRKMQGNSSLNPPTAPLPQGASIGVALEDCPPSDENDFVPLLVSLCVSVVESKGMHIQGIYRIPGNRAAVTQLIETINRGPKAFDLSDTRWSDVNVISSLLKQFFQRLPDPLIPSDLYQHFIEASRIEDPTQRLIEIKHLVQELPDHHYETLRFLCLHLSHVTSESAINKMDVRNLAIVFGPTLVRAADDNMARMVTDMSHQCRIVEMLISQVNWFFNDEDCEDPPPILPSYSGSQNPLSVESAAHASQLEASSQSLLLGNVQKLEASQKDPKKLLVSSIISAANRRVQKVRRRIEEESGSGDGGPTLRHDLSEGHRRVSGSAMDASSSLGSGGLLRGNHRDARLFADGCASDLLSKDERLEYLSSLGSLTTPSSGIPMISVDGGLNVTTALSRSEPSCVGEDSLAFRSYAGLSASTQERIRRFEMETRAMLQRDRHPREMLDKRKVDEELEKAKKDLETEDIFDRIADNPSQVVHMMGDYSWSPSRESSPCSRRPSAPSDPLKSHLAKPSLLPSNGITTNASSKVANVSSRRDFCPATNRPSDRPHEHPPPLPMPLFFYRDPKDALYVVSTSGNRSRTRRHGSPGGAAAETMRHGDRPCLIARGNKGKTSASPHFPLASSLSSPSLYPSPGTAPGGKTKKGHAKTVKKTIKGRPVSRSKSARETLLRHILPFHSSSSPRLARREASSSECLAPRSSLISTPPSHENAPNTPPNPTPSNTPPETDDLSRFSQDFSALVCLDDKLIQSDMGMMYQRPNIDGSDLLSAINATFEKMKSDQESSLFANTESNSGDANLEVLTKAEEPLDPNCSSSMNNCHSYSRSSSSSGNSGTKCKLYRDPSLHRRRQFNTGVKHSSSSSPETVNAAHNYGAKEECDSPIVDRVSTTFDSDGCGKEKSEKRTRDLMRTETQESLREKKPKELKRSDTKDFADSRLTMSGLALSSRKEKRESATSKMPSDLRSRKHNVKELKEKFERSSPPAHSVSSSPSPSMKSSTAQGSDKPSRAALKQARKAKIKRRHTVGGMKDLARVAWLKVIEAAHYTDPQKVNQVSQQQQQSAQLPTWEQLQLFLEALAEGRKSNVEPQSPSAWVAREKLGSSSPDLDGLLSLVLPPQQKEALKRRLSVREPTVKPLHPVLESNV